MVRLGMFGNAVEVYLCSSLVFGDKGVLGGVGGCDGGLGSCFGGPNDRFSRILPEKTTKD